MSEEKQKKKEIQKLAFNYDEVRDNIQTIEGEIENEQRNDSE